MSDQNPQPQGQPLQKKKEPPPIKPAGTVYDDQNQKGRDAYIYAQFTKRRKFLVGVIGDFFLNQICDPESKMSPETVFGKIIEDYKKLPGKKRIVESLQAQTADFERVRHVYASRREAAKKKEAAKK